MTQQPAENNHEGAASEKEAAEQPKPEQSEIDWKAKARDWEKRAKENKLAAERLAQIEEASKTEAQRNADRLAAAEKAAEDARNDAARYQIAAEFSLSADESDALSHVSGVDGMRQVAELLAKSRADTEAREAAQHKKAGNIVPREGHAPPNPTDDDAMARQILLGH